MLERQRQYTVVSLVGTIRLLLYYQLIVCSLLANTIILY